MITIKFHYFFLFYSFDLSDSQPSPGLENEANTRSASPPPPPLSLPMPPTLLEGLAVRRASSKCLAHTLSAPSSPSSAASVAAERTSAARSAPVKLFFFSFLLGFFSRVRVGV